MAGATARRRRRSGRSAAAGLTIAALLVGCAPGPAPIGSGAAETSGDRLVRAAIERLDAAPCPPEAAAALKAPSVEGVLCGVLTVPLDHADPDGATLDLEVALQDRGGTRGTLLALGGGPGGTSRWTAALLPLIMPDIAEAYRIVALDHRGTGADALDCPAVQLAVGTSDLLAAPPDAVRDCARRLGARAAVQSTADTIADLERLRAALGVDAWVLDGMSYGTFVAAQYALRHPDAVRALVLDSPLPPTGVDPFLRSTLTAVPGVLGSICAAEDCGFDAGAAIATLIERGYPALELLNALVGGSVVDPGFTGVLDALAAAVDGDTTALDDHVADMLEQARDEPLASFSAGAHIATLCADTPMPWGGADTDPADRTAPLTAAVAALEPADTWPFPTSLVAELGTIDACRHWPSTAYRPPATGELPDIPVLILTGERDLSTPTANADLVAAAMPGAISVVVPGAGHTAQLGPGGIAEVTEFLLALDAR